MLSEIGPTISANAEPARRDAQARPGPRLVDTTMLYAPHSGGVKRYLSAKRAWLTAERADIHHSLVVPGAANSHDGYGLWSIYTAPLPFGDGYRWPASRSAWMQRLVRRRPTLIEAGDPYTPGLAALRAGQRLGVPVVGFCHTDVAALAALHFGEWAERPIRRRWAGIYAQFDQVIAPSRYIAQRLADVGVGEAIALPLGVDLSTFSPSRADRARLMGQLGLPANRRLLVFAGRPAREKKIEVLVDAVRRLGDPYTLLLVGAGPASPDAQHVIALPYQRNASDVARILASCDAFVHANDAEPFGLVVLEAMACGLPVVGPSIGGVAETVDDRVGQRAVASTGPAFAEAVEALFDRDLVQLSSQARARAISCHGWRGVFERLCDIYAQVSGDMRFLGAGQALSHPG